MSGLDLTWNPPGPVAAAFMADWDARVIGLLGPIGSGKSTAAIFRILFSVLRQPATGPGRVRRARWAVIRNTYVELRTTTIRSWHQWVPAEMGEWVAEGPPRHTVTFRLPDGSTAELEVLFLALDRPEDARKLLSLELTGAWINEAREVPWQVVRDLRGRVGRFPPQVAGGCAWYGVVMDTNAMDTDHWWYRLFEQHRVPGRAAELTAEERTRFRLYRQPSGRSPGAENRKNLPDTYYEEAALGQDPGYVRCYIDADYGPVIAGGDRPVYPEYADGIHCRPLRVIPGLPIILGVDWGLTPAALVGQRTQMGQWRWYWEVVCERADARMLGEMVKARLATWVPAEYEILGTGDPAGTAKSQADMRLTPFKMFAAASGIRLRPAPTNNWDIRRGAVAGALKRLVDGQPGLVLDPACQITRQGMLGKYAYHRVQVAGEPRFEDAPEKNQWSHPCEAGQYMLVGGGEGAALMRPEGAPPPPAAPIPDYDPFTW